MTLRQQYSHLVNALIDLGESKADTVAVYRLCELHYGDCSEENMEKIRKALFFSFDAKFLERI